MYIYICICIFIYICICKHIYIYTYSESFLNSLHIFINIENLFHTVPSSAANMSNTAAEFLKSRIILNKMTTENTVENFFTTWVFDRLRIGYEHALQGGRTSLKIKIKCKNE